MTSVSSGLDILQSCGHEIYEMIQTGGLGGHYDFDLDQRPRFAPCVVGLVIGSYEARKIAEALGRILETASPNEGLTLAVLDRVTTQAGGQA